MNCGLVIPYQAIPLTGRVKSSTLKPSTASVAKKVKAPLNTTAIRRIKRYGMVLSDHSGMTYFIPSNAVDIINKPIIRRIRKLDQPDCGVKIFCLRSYQYHNPALRQAARLINNDRPACFSGPINARFIS